MTALSAFDVSLSRRSLLPRLLGAAAGLAMGGSAFAGGGPESVLIVIDPLSPESLYLGNYYRNARNIPDGNVLYLDPDAASYQAFAATQLAGFLGHLGQTRVDDHIDYVVVTPGNGFFIPAAGLVTDGCFAVTRFSIGSVFTMAFIKNDILATLPSTTPNRYFGPPPPSPTNPALVAPLAFDSNTAWLNGSPSTNASARRYFIGALLGYSGENGNTLDEIKEMIDRSVLADGTRPAGDFHFMNNIFDVARNVRACGSTSCNGPTPWFTNAQTALAGLGGTAQIIQGPLPTSPSDSLGVMSGFATGDIAGAPVTLIPGGFSDHMTSYACAFDDQGQTKASEWIKKGASGSAGTVDEPCNYPGKFNTVNLHVLYFRGMSMGEAYLRTLAYTPFQQLFLGDPVTRVFTHIPTVNVPNPPAGVVSGTIQITPVAQTTNPGAAIFSLDLLIDGVLHSTISSGSFTVKTAHLSDGRHDLRVLAYDNTLTKSVGRWVGMLDVNNFGRGCTLGAPATNGDLSTLFTLNVGASGGTLREIRLLQNGRVVAARTTAGASQVRGQMLGAGLVRLTAEAEFTDGRRALSMPVTLNIAYQTPATAPAAPTAFSYTKSIIRGAGAAVIELPASFNTDMSAPIYNILTAPSQGTLAGSGPWRVLTPNANACGPDQIQFRVHNSAGQSQVATVSLRYILPPVPCPADFNNDGQLTIGDFGAFQSAFVGGDPRADFNADCNLTIGDFGAFQGSFATGCP